MNRKSALLKKLGVHLSKDADILDFGCGAGHMVYSLLDEGYTNTVGYDVRDYLELRHPEDRSRFRIADGRTVLPFNDDTFDLIISDQVLEHVMDQVGVLRELHRITRPGGHAIHIFPAPYCVIEPHIYVPFGGVFGHRWWYKLWALAGVRNEFQRELSADETADRNALFFVENLNYLPNSCYETVWKKLGYEFEWIDQETFDTSERATVRMLGRLNRILPLIGWLDRTYHARRLHLIKKR
jgi:SAM-dependent methyltransferase